jgi:hypothetical protein
MSRDPNTLKENYQAIGITILSKGNVDSFYRTANCDPTSILSMSNYSSSRESMPHAPLLAPLSFSLLSRSVFLSYPLVAIEVSGEANTTYVIVPSTFNQGVHMEYFCTVYSQRPLAYAPKFLSEEEPSVSVKVMDSSVGTL